MKVFIGECGFNFPGPSGKNANEIIDFVVNLVEKYKNDKFVNVACTPHSPYLTDEIYLLKFKEISNKYNIPYHIHMAETVQEVVDYEKKNGKTEFERFDELGIIDKHFIGAHCVHLTDKDLNILSKAGATVAHCPSSNMKLGSGIARTVDMIEQGINLSIATDGSASGNNLNLIQEAELATKLQKAVHRDPSVFKSIDALKCITSNAGRPLGQNFGTIQEGGFADLVLIDCSSPELFPTYDICAAILYGSSFVDIKSVYINGKKVVDNGNVLTIDLEKVRTNFVKSVNEVQKYLGK